MAYFNTQIKANEGLKIGKPLIIDVSDPLLEGVYKSSIYDIDFTKKVMKIDAQLARSICPITRRYASLCEDGG